MEPWRVIYRKKKATRALGSWGKPVGPRRLERPRMNPPRMLSNARASSSNDVMAITSIPAARSKRDVTRPEAMSSARLQAIDRGSPRKEAIRRSESRVSVDSHSVVLKSRYDVRSTSSGSHPHHGGRPGGGSGGGGAPGHPSPVRPLGRVRLVRNQDPDDMFFTLPSLRRSRDHAPEVVDSRGPEVGRQQVQRRRQASGQTEEKGQKQKGQTRRLVGSSGSGGGQQLTGGTPALAANTAKSNNGHHGQHAPPGQHVSGPGQVHADGQGPKTKTTTTTMFINRNQCMYIERSVKPATSPLSSSAQSYRPGGDLLQGGQHTGHTVLWQQEGVAVTSSSGSGGRSTVWNGQHLTGGPPGPHYSSRSSATSSGTTSRAGSNSSSGSFLFPRVGVSTTYTGGGSPVQQQSPSPSSRAAIGSRENHDFAKKLRLVTHRTKLEHDHRKAVGDSRDSNPGKNSNPGDSNTNGGQQVDGTPARRSINLPMRIKVHLPTSAPTSGVTRERLLVEKARRDIREILRDGASGPESNHSAYSVEPYDSTAPQAKLTPVLFPPPIADPLGSPYLTGEYTGGQTHTPPAAAAATVAIYSGVEFGATCRREVTWAAGTEPETTMLTQHYPPSSSPVPGMTGSPGSPALISTHRVPLAARAQSARHGGRATTSSRAAHLAATGGGHTNNSRPASPAGYASSRPTSALSTRGMPRSRSSSISDNQTMASTPEVEGGFDGRRALWPSLIDVQRLKIGGFRYKNKPSQSGHGRAESAVLPPAAARQEAPPGQQQQQQQQLEEPHPQEQTLEARTRTIVNLGTIIVPSHTCVDCPLCNLYYAKEDLWPDGPGDSHHPHTHHDGKNTNNNNNSNNKVSVQARRAKSARPCKSTDHLSSEQWDEVDISRAAAQLNREYLVTAAPRTSPEPEVCTPPPEYVDEEELEVESVAPEVTVSEPELVKGGKPPGTVQKPMQEERVGSAQPQRALLARRRPCSSNVINSSARNPFKDFRNDGVSVTVRIPASPRRSDSKQRAEYEHLINSLNSKGPVTFKFSYVKVSHSDLLTQHTGKNKPS